MLYGIRPTIDFQKGASAPMTATALKDFYAAIGSDYDEVLSRLPSEEILAKFLPKFPADPTYDALKEAQEKRDIAAAFLAAHTLKGVSASLGLQRLAEAASALTEQLRPQKAFPEEAYFTAVDKAYAHVIKTLTIFENKE